MNARTVTERFCLIIFFLSAYLSASAGPPSVIFIENKCQWPETVHFSARVPGGVMQLNAGGFFYSFIDEQKIEEYHHQGHEGMDESGQPGDLDQMIDGHRVRVTFAGANLDSKPIPFGRRPEYYNYFLGRDASTWASNAGAYEGAVYPQYYRGIDLKVYSAGDNVKYDFYLEAGADPDQISFSYEGADRVELADGDLVIKASRFSFREKKPLAYQWIDGSQVYLPCEYRIEKGRVRFYFPDSYDACYPLVIDPLLIFSTYSGSTADNWGSTATPGEHGTLYSSGVTNHNNTGFFPATPGAFQTAYGGLYDVAILKYDSTGRQLLYASYLGGSGSESPHSLVMNVQNELLVLGTTGSTDFPTSATAFDRSFNGGTGDNNVILYGTGSDIFVARISQDGGELLSGTYLGGSANDGMNPTGSPLIRNYGDQLRGDIIPDADGNILVSTVTASSNFPVSGSFNTTYRGGISDALVLKLKGDLSQIMWGAFLGGSSSDACHSIKLDEAGNIFVAGGTSSSNFLSVPGGYQTGTAGGVDGWIAKIKPDGTQLLATTQTGTVGFDQVYFIDIDSDGNVYAYGQTNSIAFPVQPSSVFRVEQSGQFLQKFNSNLTGLLLSTVFGSGTPVPNISPTAFLVNDCNNIYMTGWGGQLNSRQGFWNSSTIGMPITPDAFQHTTSGSDFYFIVLTDNATELLYATYMGGTQSRTHVDGGTSRFDKGGVVYHSVCSGCSALNASGAASSDFPTTPGAWSKTNNSINCNNAAFKFDLSSLKARIQTNNIELNSPGFNRVCLPDPIVFQNKSTGGKIHEWDFGDGTALVKQDTTFITHFYKNPGTYRIKLRILDNGTCIGKDSTFTNVLVWEPLGFAGDDMEMCFNAGTRLIAGGGVEYRWRSEDKRFTSTEATPRVNPTEDTRYFVTITDVNGCVTRDTIDLRVIPGIDLKFDIQKVYDCFSRPEVLVKNLTDPGETVFFDFGDGNTSDLDEDQHAYQQDGIYSIRLVGQREACVYDNRIDLPVFELLVPNVITPDEFLENNTFKILYGGRKLSESSLKAHFVVYNRWGNKVFESKDYRDDWNGSNVEAGVYYYDLTVEGEASCRGWVQVIK